MWSDAREPENETKKKEVKSRPLAFHPSACCSDDADPDSQTRPLPATHRTLEHGNTNQQPSPATRPDLDLDLQPHLLSSHLTSRSRKKEKKKAAVLLSQTHSADKAQAIPREVFCLRKALSARPLRGPTFFPFPFDKESQKKKQTGPIPPPYTDQKSAPANRGTRDRYVT
jgi:hypothetical protein